MDALWADLKYGSRMLVKSPGFTLAAVITLALGIGLNSAIFSLVNAVLFKPLPVDRPDDLATVWNIDPGGFISHQPMAFPDYADLRDGNRSFESLAAYALTPLAVDRGDESEMVIGQIVTENYFSMLGVQAIRGRTFLPEEARERNANPHVVLSHSAWQRRFGGNQAIVGQPIRVNGHLFNVIGVTPEGFEGVIRGFSPELWVPMMMSPTLNAQGAIRAEDGPTEGSGAPRNNRLDNRGSRWLWVMGRLKPGISLAQAGAEMHTLGERLRQQYPETNKDRPVGVLAANEVKVLPGVDRALYATSFVLLGLVALVLLIASANVANMLLARAVTRRKEVAIRLSIGAGRARLVRQLLTESLLLSLLGGGGGLILAWWTNTALNVLPMKLSLPVQLSLGLQVDGRVLIFTFSLAVLTALIFGLAPALQASRNDTLATLKEETGTTAGGGSRRHLARALIVAQVAVSLILLIGAGLSARSMMNAHRINPGFDPAGVAVCRFMPELRGLSPAQQEEFFRRLTERLRAAPGVESVALASHTPLAFEINIEGVAAEGKEPAERKDWPEVDAAQVGPDYFRTLRIPILRGRPFTEQDNPTRRVAIVNEALASRFWPGDDPVGQHLKLEGESTAYEVVGVAANGKYRTLGEDPRPFLYRPVLRTERSYPASMVLVRTSGELPPILSLIRAESRQVDEKVPASGLLSLEQTISVSLLFPRMGAVVFGLFGGLGLLLATIGLYGVIGYHASQRTHEIGIRMALGAEPGNILKLVVGEGLALTMIGIALGLAGAFMASGIISVLLYGISPNDPVTFASITLLLLLVALSACYLPARRAAATDPMTALRCQ